jgi:hypothetical protein
MVSSAYCAAVIFAQAATATAQPNPCWHTFYRLLEAMQLDENIEPERQLA